MRSRAMSTALKNVFNQTGNVFVMGHRFPDMDAIGSAFGVACLARYHDKKFESSLMRMKQFQMSNAV